MHDSVTEEGARTAFHDNGETAGYRARSTAGGGRSDEFRRRGGPADRSSH
ncbi:hypothetical protein [Streptomyces goshikiensis]